uniref:Wsv267-like protein n=1 Tax=Sicyonia whispovirus TaxID=2984283 RepID=A0A9C7F7A7_9VIRU|nr:MAG: wsv267-like protein [Sicyonia whispovirus]
MPPHTAVPDLFVLAAAHNARMLRDRGLYVESHPPAIPEVDWGAYSGFAFVDVSYTALCRVLAAGKHTRPCMTISALAWGAFRERSENFVQNSDRAVDRLLSKSCRACSGVASHPFDTREEAEQATTEEGDQPMLVRASRAVSLSGEWVAYQEGEYYGPAFFPSRSSRPVKWVSAVDGKPRALRARLCCLLSAVAAHNGMPREGGPVEGFKVQPAAAEDARDVALLNSKWSSQAKMDSKGPVLAMLVY